MKKTIRIAAIVSALLILASCAAGCKKHKPEEPEVTPAPVMEFSLVGDWYGVFSITDADGKYRDNSGIMNDCVMRLSPGENGAGSCYIAVNGIGELFTGCSAEAFEDGVLLTGKVGGSPVSWRLIKRGAKLTMSEIFGAGSDYMRIELIMKHCGDEWSGAPIPEGYEYTLQHGFGSLVEAMGGSKAKLPAVSAEGANLRLSEDEDPGPAEPDGPRFNDEGRTVSSNGCFSAALPEGFTVTEDGTQGFTVANEEKGVRITYTVYVSNEDPLKKLADSKLDPAFPNISVFHFVISGFDCYAAPCEAESGSGSELVLYGTDGSNMLEIHYETDRDAYYIFDMLKDAPEDFTACVLDLLVHPSER